MGELSSILRDPKQFIIAEETRSLIADNVAVLEREIERLSQELQEARGLIYVPGLMSTCIHTAGVAGSNPASPTIFFNYLTDFTQR